MQAAQVDAAVQQWFIRAQWQPLGAGHIHNTYLVEAASGQYVLQAINEYVFKDAELVMTQTQRLLTCWQTQQRYRVARLVESRQGRVAERVGGQLWRVWQYLADSRIVDPVASVGQARAAAAAFGFFQSHMTQLPEPRFKDSINGFLQLDHYLQVYDEVVAQNKAAGVPGHLTKLISAQRELAVQFAQRNANIHGDCKINNLLFDTQGETVLAVIDFDTAMYGHWAWDFGDLVRSICHSRGAVDLPYFTACVEGFVPHQPLATSADCVAAPAYVALMLGVRFLTDHLQGDVYFRVAQPGENLLRAEEQFRLCEAFVASREQMAASAAAHF